MWIERFAAPISHHTRDRHSHDGSELLLQEKEPLARAMEHFASSVGY